MENKFEQLASKSQSEHQVKEFRQLKRLKKMLEINEGDTLKCKSLNKQIKKAVALNDYSVTVLFLSVRGCGCCLC